MMIWLAACLCLAPASAFLQPANVVHMRGHKALHASPETSNVPQTAECLSRGSFVTTCTSFASVLVAASSQPGQAQAIGDLPELATEQRFISAVLLNTPDATDAVRFFTKGLGMKVSGAKESPTGESISELSFGPTGPFMPADFVPGVTSFNGYGGHVALELVEPEANPEHLTFTSLLFSCSASSGMVLTYIPNLIKPI
ncbi:unnamed protein product [Chrysoparadoxa australica]